jgi:hypothetical protein
MGFGRNPHVPKARAAEQKAADAPDDATRTRAYRDAAHQWDRAAEREPPGKNRAEYERNAARNRELADGAAPEDAAAPVDNSDDTEGGAGASVDPKLLN